MWRDYGNGMSAGQPGPGSRAEDRAKRGKVTGWSAGAVRRHTRWLYSVDAEALTVSPAELELAGSPRTHPTTRPSDADVPPAWTRPLVGVALTLTVRTLPESPEEWDRVRRAWIEALRIRGLVRLHWVTEWQRRGVPHLHVAAYFDRDDPAVVVGEEALALWVIRTAERFGALPQSQTWNEIDGPLGWLQYLSKHAARGVKHYQRQGKPEAWESTGRLWGKIGDWPLLPAQDVEIDWATFWRLRRLIRSWRVADARQALLDARDEKSARAARRRITYARRMLASDDPKLSRVRGISDWVPSELTQQLHALLLSEGRRMMFREQGAQDSEM